MALDEQDVRDRVRYATELHSEAQSRYDEVEELLTLDYDVPEDVQDLGVEIFQPAKAQAIFAKALSICRSRAKETIEVTRLDGTKREEERTTRLEKYARAVMERGAEGRQVDPYLSWVMWFLAYGKGVLEWRYMPQYQDEESMRFPLRPLAPRANTVCEVYGDQGVVFYAKKYTRMALDMKAELEGLWDEGKAAEWELPKLDNVDPTDEVDVIEYWDDTYKALVVGDEFVWLNEHKYGFCPIVVSYCEPLPMDEAEYWGQGMIRPIAQDIKQHAAMMSKLITGLQLQFWPRAFVKGTDGMLHVVQANPGAMYDMAPDAQVVMVPTDVNEALLEHTAAWINEDINLMSGLPPLAYGKEPSGQASGYMVAQILGQILDRFEQKLDDIGRAKSEHIKQLFQLSKVLMGDEWGDVTEGKGYSVSAQPEPGQRRRAMLTINKEDVEDYRQVHVEIKPRLAQEGMVLVQIAERLRTPGVDGRPMMSDYSIREKYLEVDAPDVEEERITDQEMRRLDEVKAQEIQKWLDEYWKGEEGGRPQAEEQVPGEGVNYYKCTQCSFKAPSKEDMTGKPCPVCGAPLVLDPTGGPMAGPEQPQGMEGMVPPNGQGMGQVPGLQSQYGGSVQPGQPPPDQLTQMMQQMGAGVPPRPGG